MAEQLLGIDLLGFEAMRGLGWAGVARSVEEEFEEAAKRKNKALFDALVAQQAADGSLPAWAHDKVRPTEARPLSRSLLFLLPVQEEGATPAPPSLLSQCSPARTPLFASSSHKHPLLPARTRPHPLPRLSRPTLARR